MSITPAIKATQLGFVRGLALSNWNSSGAYQGQYTGSAPRVGVMLFGGLHDINWREQSISKIELTLTFSGAGKSAEKTLSLYRGTKSGISGTGESMVGERIGDVKTNGTAYKSTRTITFSPNVNANAYIQLVAWMRSMTTNTLVIYRDEALDSSYSPNYLQITAASMVVEYELAGSTGTLDKDTVDAGRPIALTIEPMESDGTVTHAVEWIFGTHTSGVQDLADGLSASYSVPPNWLDQIPNAVKGTAYCRLHTYVDGKELSAQDIPYTLTAPFSAFPTASVQTTPLYTVGGYWQHIGAARIEVLNASGKYGATIKSIRITGPEGVDSDQSVTDTPKFALSGIHRYTVVVTDSRGMMQRITPSITVDALSPPVIYAFSAARYAAKIGDYGETIYAENLAGGHVWFNVQASIDPADGNNAMSAYILYGPAGRAQRTRVDIPTLSDSWIVYCVNDRTILTADIPLNSAYEFQLVIEDGHTSASWTVRVEKSSAIAHFAGNGHGFMLGGFSGGSITDKRFDVSPEWTSHFPGGAYGYGDYRMDRAETSMSLPITNAAFAPYSNGLAPRISRVGPVIWLEGMLRNTADLANGFEEIVAVLPEWARPHTDAFALHQGSGQCIFWLRAYANGNLMICRYRDLDDTVSAASGKQFPLTLSWLAADAFMQTFSITSTTIGCANENADTSILEGRAYAAKLKPETGKEVTSITLTMGGEDALSYYDPENSLIHIPIVTGNIAIHAEASETPAALIQITDDGNGNVTATEVIEGSLLYEETDGDVDITKYATATVVDDGEGNVELR